MGMFSFLLLATAAFAEDATPDGRPKYCEEPSIIIRGEPEAHVNPRDEDVLNANEAADPQLAQMLAAMPGPYGHSELGFRYLARLFGYSGAFSTREEVESWIMMQESESYARKKGLWQIWEHWVVNPQKRLAVPRGAVNALPSNGNPTMFFLDARDRAAFARCLKIELAMQLCQNYEGRGRAFREKDVVLFAGSRVGSEKFGYCQVRVPPWRVDEEKRHAAEYNHGLGKPEGAKVDDNKSAK